MRDMLFDNKSPLAAKPEQEVIPEPSALNGTGGPKWTLASTSSPLKAPPPPGSWQSPLAGKMSGLAEERLHFGAPQTATAKYSATQKSSLADVPTRMKCSSAGELFADMTRTGQVEMSRVGTRLKARHLKDHVADPTGGSDQTDYSRIGVGGDGVDPRSGLYAGTTARFTTTDSAYYAPLKVSVLSVPCGVVGSIAPARMAGGRFTLFPGAPSTTYK